MFTERSETKLEILDNGVINVTVLTHYFKNDAKIGEDNWGCCLEPIPVYLEYAKTILDDYYYNIVKTAWTDDVMAQYAKNLESKSLLSNQERVY